MTEDRRNNPETERLERLYRQAADAEPDGRIDDAVLGRARKAVSARRRRALPYLGPWGVGIAAAASVVLGVGLFYQVGWESGPAAPDMQQFRAEPEAEVPDRPASPPVGASSKAESAAEPATVKKARELDRAESSARARQDAGMEDSAGQPASFDEHRLSEPVPAEEAERLSPEARLERIRDLIEEGQLDEAREDLREFQASHPSVEIPAAIQEALAPDPE